MGELLCGEGWRSNRVMPAQRPSPGSIRSRHSSEAYLGLMQGIEIAIKPHLKVLILNDNSGLESKGAKSGPTFTVEGYHPIHRIPM